MSTIFELLLDRRRRTLLYYLSRTVGAVPLEELVAELEHQASGSADPESVRTDIHHRHLPKLIGAAIVEYDRAAGTVELLPAATRLEPYLELAAEDDQAVLGRSFES